MEIGMITTTAGLNLDIASAISKLDLTDMSKGVGPWLLTMRFFLMIIAFSSRLSLWLPRTLGIMHVASAHHPLDTGYEYH
jgi:C4-dicarboxylate transporter DctM subunit